MADLKTYVSEAREVKKNSELERKALEDSFNLNRRLEAERRERVNKAFLASHQSDQIDAEMSKKSKAAEAAKEQQERLEAQKKLREDFNASPLR